MKCARVQWLPWGKISARTLVYPLILRQWVVHHQVLLACSFAWVCDVLEERKHMVLHLKSHEWSCVFTCVHTYTHSPSLWSAHNDLDAPWSFLSTGSYPQAGLPSRAKTPQALINPGHVCQTHAHSYDKYHHWLHLADILWHNSITADIVSYLPAYAAKSAAP